ncbi:MAG: ABC-type antimicrobial peptide transport system, permease component [Verrucomicrobiales bacterium]|nr:ABC-type antimicrobial peptide transport system, permease component [Verrucomicrobiales bacterium]
MNSTPRILRITRSVKLGVKSLWLHKLRSFLTALGIVFGVCSVIAMLAIGEGASYEAQEQIKNLGSQNIIVRSVKPPEDQKISGRGTRSFALEYGLKHADVQRIRQTIPNVSVIVPGRIMREYVWNISRRVDCDIIATVPWFPEMRHQHVAQGRFFNDKEMDDATTVCVVGSSTAKSLFPFDSPIGANVRVGGDYYKIIGVMEPSSATSTDVNDKEKPTANQMFIPLNTAKSRYGEVLRKFRSGSLEMERVQLHEITVKAATPETVPAVADAIRVVLERNHKKKDYDVIVPLELLQRAERTKQIFNIVLGSIAAISLLVGGIGIMNIMLASVTERTREIGIRRALGAKRRDIVTQFLVETVTLSGTGGVIGVVLGVTIPWFVSHFAGMKTITTLWAPLLAFGISAAVGVVFGIYPAMRAANMDPVEALRHE